jgi:mannose-1-phosphate guanylyltransferase/mannose-6-phosphate isomerase
MERTDRAAVVRARFDWSDLGDWEAVWRHLPRDGEGNALSGQIELLDAHNNLIFADSGMVAVADVDDLVIVASGDAVLVADRRRPERVKLLVEKVQARGHRQGSEHLRIYRPWGWYQTMDSGPRFQVKRIAVRPGCRLSLQRHHHRAEHWIVVRGTAEVTINGNPAMLSENESTYIPIGSTHRLAVIPPDRARADRECRPAAILARTTSSASRTIFRGATASDPRSPDRRCACRSGRCA